MPQKIPLFIKKYERKLIKNGYEYIMKHMKNSRPKDISASIEAAPKEAQTKLAQIREIIKSLAPKAEEVIYYGMPAFKMNGKYLFCFASFKHHIGFYPVSGTFFSAYKKDLEDYVTSKGAVQFPMGKPLPVALIKKLVKGKIQQIKN